MDFRMFPKKALGDYGEGLAAAFLEQAGLTIVRRNYRCPKGEIDLIAKEADSLVFVEVRTRTSEIRGTAAESIDPRKLAKMKSTASCYLKDCGYAEWPPLRFDAVAIQFRGEKPEIQWLKGVW